MMQFVKEVNLYLWISIIMFLILIIAAVFYLPEARKLSSAKAKKKEDNEGLFEIIEDAGYSYDPDQDIFYSNMDPWQRKMGYCRLYDEASAPLNMIIDCEPVYFEYGGKRWMIEFWKGQYGMTAGGEIGVYNTEEPDMDIPGFFNGTFYNCAKNEDLLYMAYSLFKNDKLLFERKGRHWWLTGFKLGEFAEPSELVMYMTVALKDREMCTAFVEGLKKAGYSENEIFVDDNIVGLVYKEPHSPQPVTRIPETDWLIQKKNELLCSKYREMTRDYDSFPEKMNVIREQAPELYDAILHIGKTKPIFEVYEKIKEYLS